MQGTFPKRHSVTFQVANEYGGEKPQTKTQDLYIHMEMKPGLNQNIKRQTSNTSDGSHAVYDDNAHSIS